MSKKLDLKMLAYFEIIERNFFFHLHLSQQMKITNLFLVKLF